MFGLLTDLVELQGHSALAVSSRVLVQNALSDSLIDLLDRDLVSAIGLGAIAFSGSRLELLDGSLQIGLRSLIARVRTSPMRTRFLADLIFGKPNTSSWHFLARFHNFHRAE